MTTPTATLQGDQPPLAPCYEINTLINSSAHRSSFFHHQTFVDDVPEADRTRHRTMLSPSVRRAAASSPQSPLFTTAAASVTRSTYRPISSTRRYSSSKPSRDDGSKAPPVRQQAVPATGEGKSKSSSASVSAPGERRKRKAKDAAEKLNYPSVPTTAHIPSDCKSLGNCP